MPEQSRHPDDPHRQPTELLTRVRDEFLEMPGMHLTPGQAARLWHVTEEAAVAALKTLADRPVSRPNQRGGVRPPF